MLPIPFKPSCYFSQLSLFSLERELLWSLALIVSMHVFIILILCTIYVCIHKLYLMVLHVLELSINISYFSIQ